MLDKTYRPQEVEDRIYAAWEQGGFFQPRRRDDSAEPYCIVLPPPNVTGSLHMGHALDHTIQDVLIRYHRMRGREVLWQPGTDHAGIATQMVVERELAKEGTNLGRREIGREAFVAKVWEWKEQSGGTIVRQMRRLGTSPDWTRLRFTMDEGLSAAVLEAFVALYKQGLIYRDKRLVNWDCQLQTAVSDLEVQQTEVDGQLWHINYPIEGEPDLYITVATTRPETMLGDVAVAVHPDDERWRYLVGRHAVLPLVGRRLPIIADSFSDPEKGTGAVKITPAHDFGDFEVGRRHDLPLIAIMDEQGRINGNAPQPYPGLDRFDARKRVVADLEMLGRVARIEKHKHTVPHGDRSGTPLEPLLTDQWYCDAKALAGPAIAAVEGGRTRFVPKQWESTYFEWMRNIQPWCISRQLWWGHQIPAWYAPDGKIFVEKTAAEAEAAAAAHYGHAVALVRDPDVLDTWFSSGLWPMSTLGWPEETPELGRFYPTSVLVTGFDIIFFWVARMMMLGLHFGREVPFKDVYIHGLVRDERGAKMSKTKGNVIDPLELVDAYGADALRLALLASTAQGRDVKFGPSRVEGYRNFVTKLWNAARFIEMNSGPGEGVAFDPSFAPERAGITLNRWIIGETAKTGRAVTDALREYRFNDAALGLYHFVWATFCDWYIELSKPLLTGDDEPARNETRATAAWVLAQTLHLLHPLAPFVTEELWERLFDRRSNMLIGSSWPDCSSDLTDQGAADEIGWVIQLISLIRSVRAEYTVPSGAKLTPVIRSGGGQSFNYLQKHMAAIQRLAKVDQFSMGGHSPPPKHSAYLILGTETIAVPLENVIDLAAERTRLGKEIAKGEAEATKLQARLGNAEFVAKAPEDVVEEQRERLRELRDQASRFQAALERIS